MLHGTVSRIISWVKLVSFIYVKVLRKTGHLLKQLLHQVFANILSYHENQRVTGNKGMNITRNMYFPPTIVLPIDFNALRAYCDKS